MIYEGMWFPTRLMGDPRLCHDDDLLSLFKFFFLLHVLHDMAFGLDPVGFFICFSISMFAACVVYTRVSHLSL